MMYSLNEVGLIPSTISDVKHRKDVDIFDENGYLPIMVSPMTSISSISDIECYQKEKIIQIIPRNESILKDDYHNMWKSYSLNDFKSIFIDDESSKEYIKKYSAKALIDIANGNMRDIFSYVKLAKSIHGDNLILMIGNIANPYTYRYCVESGVDYVRVSVGTGSVCFVKNTKITMSNNSFKNIEDVKIGDYVKTLDGNQKVVNTYKKHTDVLIKVNDTKCTPNHKFLVINKKDKEVVTEDNIKKYSYWVEAKNLTKDMLLVSD